MCHWLRPRPEQLGPCEGMRWSERSQWRNVGLGRHSQAWLRMKCNSRRHLLCIQARNFWVAERWLVEQSRRSRLVAKNRPSWPRRTNLFYRVSTHDPLLRSRCLQPQLRHPGRRHQQRDANADVSPWTRPEMQTRSVLRSCSRAPTSCRGLCFQWCTGPRSGVQCAAHARSIVACGVRRNKWVLLQAGKSRL